MKISKNAWWTLGFVLLVVLVFGMLTIIGQESGAQQATAHQPGGALSPAASPAAQAEKKLRVSVYGAVQHEGEMLLPAHATVRDLSLIHI